ncbi:TetR/AcrR family transcriptional regulator [Cryptosporangium aurantiacum]|uniref:Transcriptional regulator, TetR family n=1 Tax=Cryptosporangium aurantiacum TaxID=134849 RepID=A0A1M7JDA1_9ACTN|nr:TetR/AcrR family transcriptional regulator [Cryptosporangium aurantiacum]SHM50999.1 transcriptional regulator, TetR family [Cryptosporangium aurantiacum]
MPDGLRADARRNRARVLEVAIEAFATEGLAVPIHEIARRAGVGTGTVSRHFPTKESLFQAIVSTRVEHLVTQARAIEAEHAPGDAFFVFFGVMAAEGALDRGLADALIGAGFDIDAAADSTGYDLNGHLERLLAAAQEAGTVRGDVDFADVKALLAGCLARERGTADAAARDRMITIVRAGLRPEPGTAENR